ncbi:hypothetical protein C0993_003612 [Termitomyces sp. T159_Od127]|nr:hypothetical protein C0993_003612 [Termitomyces sp. T159_Od127]
MSIETAIEKYLRFSVDILSDVKIWNLGAERFKATVFESSMKHIIKSAGFSEDVLMQEDDPLCKSFVVALPVTNMTPQIFRTYQVRANYGYDCTIVQAARATTATADLFKPVSIKFGGVTETFVGAGLGYGNPTRLVLEEAEAIFGPSQSVAYSM